MFGNMINNKQLLELCDVKAIDITPFDANLVRAVHYPMHVLAIRSRTASGTWRVNHNFQDDEGPYDLAANEYVVVDIQEHIKLKEGIVGQFVAASNLVEAGLGITAGRLEHPFGQRGEVIRFGIKNMLSEPNIIKRFQKVAYAQFFDLRGLASKLVVLSEEEFKLLASRVSEGKKKYAQDAGPIYEEEIGLRVDRSKK